MKKRTILYILTIILTLFSYNQTVNAAQELTCLYKKGSEDKIMLVQDKNGKVTIYQSNADTDRKINDYGWQKTNVQISLNEDFVDEPLKECPKYQAVTYDMYYEEEESGGADGYSSVYHSAENYDKFLESNTPRVHFFNEIHSIYSVVELEESIKKAITPKKTKELTCKYDTIPKLILHQFEDGTKNFYITDSDGDGGYETSLWYPIEHDLKLTYKRMITLGENDYLNECPRYVKYINANMENYGYEIEFSDTAVTGNPKLIDEQFSIIEMNNMVKPPSNLNTDSLITLDETKYTASCKYIKELDDSSTHIIQINFGLNNMLVTEFDMSKGIYSGIKFKYDKTDNINRKSFEFTVKEELLLQNILNKYMGECPVWINVTRDTPDPIAKTGGHYQTQYTYYNNIISTTITDDNDKNNRYFLKEANGKNPITEKKLSIDGSIKPDFIKEEITSCKDLLGDDISNIFTIVWNIIKIGIPIILIVLGSLDFAMAVFSGKEDGMKKAQSKFIKRLIIAVVIFVIPTLLSFILNISNEIWGIFGENADICGIIF